jgi:hypothetical protein
VIRILSGIGRVLGRCTRSRLGWLLVSIHSAWFFIAIARMGSPCPECGTWAANSSTTLVAGRPFHFAYEPLMVRILWTADMPAMIAMIPASIATALLLWPFHMGFYRESYVYAALMLVGATAQWLIIGSRIGRWLSAWTRPLSAQSHDKPREAEQK